MNLTVVTLNTLFGCMKPQRRIEIRELLNSNYILQIFLMQLIYFWVSKVKNLDIYKKV